MLILAKNAGIEEINSVMETHKTKTVEKNRCVFRKTLCASKANLAFGFFLKNTKTINIRKMNTHEDSPLLDWLQRSLHTGDDKPKLKEVVNKMFLIQVCTRERVNTKISFYSLSNWTVFDFSHKKNSYGLQRCRFAKTTFEESNSELSYFEENRRQP